MPLVAGLIIANSLSSDFLVNADPAFLRLCMGIFVLLADFILIREIRYKGPRGPEPSFGISTITGVIMSGAGVQAGPVMVIYYFAAPEPPSVQRANIMVSVWLLLIIMLTNLLMRDAIMAKTATSGVLIAPASIIGASFGQYLFKRAPLTSFKKFAHGLLVVIGISMLVI